MKTGGRYSLAVAILFIGFSLFQLLAAAFTGEIMIGGRTGSRWRSWESSPGRFGFGILFWTLVAAFWVWIVRKRVGKMLRERGWLRRRDRQDRYDGDPQP